MKNLGNIVLLLAVGAGYVASLPAGEAPANQVRGYDDAVNDILARVPKAKGAAAAAGMPISLSSNSPHTSHEAYTNIVS